MITIRRGELGRAKERREEDERSEEGRAQLNGWDY
jgi:hypothetical protein